MSLFVVLFVVGVALMVSFVLWKFVYIKPLNDIQFEKKRFFLTVKQRVFYQALKQSAGDKYIVFANVSMAEVIRSSRNMSKGKRAAYIAKLQKIQAPFVLCEANSLVIVAGVMLDEQAQHDTQSLMERQFVTQVFKSVGLPLLLFKVKNTYDVKLMEQSLRQKIGESQPESTQDSLSDVGEDTDESVIELILKPMSQNVPSVLPQEQVCPKCGEPMLLKKAEKGRRAGKHFLMCSAFPACKRAIPIESHKEGDINQPATVV